MQRVVDVRVDAEDVLQLEDLVRDYRGNRVVHAVTLFKYNIEGWESGWLRMPKGVEGKGLKRDLYR